MARHPEAGWVFVYTREAHPGENVGYHDSIEAKLACARLLREDAGISRDILVDAYLAAGSWRHEISARRGRPP